MTCFLLIDATEGDPPIDDDESSDVGSHVIVPEVGDVTSLQHDALATEKVQEIVDDLTRRVFGSVYSRSVNHAHMI